ncbi:hypothetical protein SCLCIDRAFT_587852 [Scleroderma citrinum Foug A]|uniref:Uncharacterized protein n=1 Tax=Scleroderma citrinum Foug A TaxID=1036808 RepID=A0A0C2ZGN8_9AGAM|nr:hypothetical protein SCLCIDRAFT_587852 [Scleroderma citrinum Foug A]
MPHYNGPTNPCAYSLDGAVGDTYTHPENHTCDFYRPCQYPDSHGGHCKESFSCTTASAHFRDMHGIVDLTRSGHVTCQWTGCGRTVSRHNFIRHMRERHLFHQRWVVTLRK